MPWRHVCSRSMLYVIYDAGRLVYNAILKFAIYHPQYTFSYPVVIFISLSIIFLVNRYEEQTINM